MVAANGGLEGAANTGTLPAWPSDGAVTYPESEAVGLASMSANAVWLQNGTFGGAVPSHSPKRRIESKRIR